jgi:P-type conjugative transfer protein TrbJ
MMSGIILLLSLLLLTLPARSQAYVLIVEDPALIAKHALEYAEQIRQYNEQIAQTKNQMEQIRQQAINLMSLRLNKAQDLLYLQRQLERNLAQARWISYNANRASSQAAGLYPKITGVSDAAQRRSLERQWAAAQRDSAEVAIATQAIEERQARYQQEWATVLDQAAAAQGNLQIEQANAQGLGLLGGQLQSIEQQLATQARERSQQAMEGASRTEMEQQALEHTTGSMDTTYTPQGQRLRLSTGQE